MAKPTPSRAVPKPPRSWGRIIKRIFIWLLIFVLVIMVLGALAAVVAYRTVSLPDPSRDFQTNTSFLYYRDGKTKLGSLAVQNRQTIDYTEMPDNIKNAVISAENRSFWEDRGISPGGIARSAWAIARGGQLQSGSTITQQYIKVLYLNSERTMKRKLKELILAIKMGQELPKEEILEGYLNTIYFGRSAYGIQAAAKSYFLTDAKNLTLQQSATLAAILNNPGRYNPSKEANLDRLHERYRYVLDGMLEMGKISKAEHDAAAAKLPDFPEVPISNRYGGPKGFLIKKVEAELAENGFSEDQIFGGGLQVVTTFDPAAQQAAESTAQKYTQLAAEKAKVPQDPKQLHAAIASVETETGEVLALYGGPDFVKNSRNWATTDRSTASTFKTYALAAGLRNGFGLKDKFNGNTFTPKGDAKPVRNEFSYQYGQVNLIKATADSINTAFVDLTEQMPNGAREVEKAANDAGVPTGNGWDLNNRISLGVAEASPLDQASGYATFANDGTHVPAHVVREVRDHNGKVLYSANVKPKSAFESDVAADVTHALSAVVDEGTGRRVSVLDRPIAGKTGTAGVGDKIISAWFVAYTKQISTAVMFVAGDDGVGNLDPYARPQDKAFFGGSYPAQVWAEYMKVATKDQPVEEFPKPGWVNGGKPSSPTPKSKPTPTPSATPTQTQPTSQPTSGEPPKDQGAPPNENSSGPTTHPTDPSVEPSSHPTKPTSTPTPNPSKPPNNHPRPPIKPPSGP